MTHLSRISGRLKKLIRICGSGMIWGLFWLLALLLPVKAEVEGEAKIKVLLVDGNSNHDWKKRLNILRAILSKDGSFEVDFSITPSTANDPAWDQWRPDFSKYDVVVSGYNSLGGRPPWPQAVRTAFEQYVHGGGGFLAYHEANNSFEEWPEYNNMIGLGWRNASFGPAITLNANGDQTLVPAGQGENTNHGPRINALVKKKGSHPITAGLPSSWTAADIEVYRYARGPAQNLTVLSYALHTGNSGDVSAGRYFPIDWVVNYGEGRVYASSYGHVWADQAQPSGTRCAAFQTLFIRAIKWLAKRDPGTVVPSDFPGTASPSLRPFETGVSGLDQAEAVGAYANGVLPSLPSKFGAASVERGFANLSWESPIDAKVFPGSTDLLVVEANGRIFRVADDDAATEMSLVLDIRNRVWYYNWTPGNNNSKHGGLQTITLHPRFGTGEGKDYLYAFYIHRSDTNPDALPPYYTRLSRFSWDATSGTFDPASELIMIQQYDTVKGHDGGGMAFGADGFLYIGYGDEGSQGTAAIAHTQRLNDRVRSGIWRLDVDQQGGEVSHPIRRQPRNAQVSHGSYTQGYYVPSDNPWAEGPAVTEASVLEEFYALGTRQPHRVSFDSLTGWLWIGDVGHSAREEISVMDRPGLNFQWTYKEGKATGYGNKPSPLIGTERGPIFDYSHSGSDSLGKCVIGGHVYRGNAIPWLRGHYLFGDNVSQGVFALEYDQSTQTAVKVIELGEGRAGGLFQGISSFAIDSRGEPLVLQMGGGVAGAGRIYRIKPLPPETDPSAFPLTLSATGLFTDLATLTPAPGLIPYDVNMPLWSDGTGKGRWIMIPNDGNPNTAAERITYSEDKRWKFPIGTVFVKHFALPDGGRNLETRVLVLGSDGVLGGVTYKWLPDGSDAELLEDGAMEEVIIDGVASDYLYPSRLQCMTCHLPSAGGVLGPSTWQMNRRYTYEKTGRTANQIETFSKLGFISQTLTEVELMNSLKAANKDDDTYENRELYVRSYLDANCAHCHFPEGNARGSFDLRFTTPLWQQGLLCGDVADDMGIAGLFAAQPGNLDHSSTFIRMTSEGHDRMPPLGRSRTDTEAVTVFADWLLSMKVDSCVRTAASGEPVVLGTPATPSSPTSDSWESNMVIDLATTIVNNTDSPQSFNTGDFRFWTTRITGTPLTPFIVRVNGTGSFTVLAIGKTVTSHVVGYNQVPFSDVPKQFILGPGEKLAVAFLDALPNGSGAGGIGVMAFVVQTNYPIHYSGSKSPTNSSSIVLGQSPTFVAPRTDFGRRYFFSVTLIPTTTDADGDGNGLPDSWELAYTETTGVLAATKDSDGDGTTDFDEMQAGTHPLDASSTFRVVECSPEVEGDRVLITFDSVPGREYRVFTSSNLATWDDQGAVQAASWPETKTAFQIDYTNSNVPKKLFLRLTTR